MFVFSFFFFFKLPSSPLPECLCCREPQILESASDLLRDSKLTPNFRNTSSISYLLIAVCIEGEGGFRAWSFKICEWLPLPLCFHTVCMGAGLAHGGSFFFSLASAKLLGVKWHSRQTVKKQKVWQLIHLLLLAEQFDSNCHISCLPVNYRLVDLKKKKIICTTSD